ncbi:protein phosphatase 2C 29 [Tanacetum coccineum]|uniref:Protein phosphatase 2C 29 n=1 Tax=Tanacetum coccineum TaxID=301880 RepID=A0ABQ4WYW2_9ASTR
MNRQSSKKSNVMGYQKSPTLSSNNNKKNVGVGGSGSFGSFPALSSNSYKQKTNIGGGNSARYGGSSSLTSNGYKKSASVGGFRSSRGYGGSKSVGSDGASGGLINYVRRNDPQFNPIHDGCPGAYHENIAALLMGLEYLLSISYVDDTEVFKEVVRIKNEHPDDNQCIVNGRVKGRLKVTRAFGAGFLKQIQDGESSFSGVLNFVMGTSRYQGMPSISVDDNANVSSVIVW